MFQGWQLNGCLQLATRTVQLLLSLCAVAFLFVQHASSEDLESKIDRYLKDKAAAKQFSGRVLVARGDNVLVKGDYGQAERKLEAANENRFPVGAVAEQFVAVAVLQLEQQGKMKIDAPICKYVPNCPANWKDIQVVHLLTHTSGLPSFQGAFANQTDSDTLTALLAAVGGRSLGFKPGSEFKYNELDFIVLGLAIEIVSSRPASEFIEREVFQTLKMTDTAYLDRKVGGSPDPSLENAADPGEPGGLLRSDHFYSTVEDLYRFDRALIQGAAITSASLLEMLTPYRDGRGLGWKINKEFDKRLALQKGRSDGGSVCVRLYPDDDVYIILVAEANDIDSAELTYDLGAIVFGKSYPASRKSASTSPAAK
ncbi:MAG TPA: serine hydrolase domain-containing protein [Candidatus Sulfotelmatobacter sp.]|nr:serine hydrolase domain-containing protein [Candidatus Sulfotelmatobacter sp.]